MDNLSKVLSYLVPLSKSVVIVDGKEVKNSATAIKLSTSFFLKDSCESCGSCCVTESNLYTQSEYDRIMSATDQEFIDYGLDPQYLHTLRDGLIKEHHVINGKDVVTYVYLLKKTHFYLPVKGKDIDRCSWLFTPDDNQHFYCHIHPVTSITCRMPHFRFVQVNGGSVSLGTTQFGRNWAMKCPVQLIPSDETTFEDVKKAKLEKLKHLLRDANDLNIDTYLPEIIEYVQKIPFEHQLDYLGKNIISKPKVKKLM